MGWSFTKRSQDAVQRAVRQAVARVCLALVSAGCSAAPAPTAPARPDLIPAPAGAADVTPFIAGEVARARASTRRVLVYVGASWCEPCRRFHDALSAGELDRPLAGWRFVEFDYDADHVALERAGYTSQLIPLFTLPKPDGSASDRHIEGSIKGPAAVAQNLLPRLRELIAEPAPRR
jgi:thiol-disulfide isomerase/thioredoxin